MTRKLAAMLAAAAAVVALTAVPAIAAPIPEGATWTEQTITEVDGTKLHADILRPSHLPGDAKTPVIVSIGPYFGHAGQLGAVGAAQGEDYDPTGPSVGPSSRFHDLIEGAKLMERGYTFVMVDLRGFGGSTGCLDWAGPGELADVAAAVDFARTAPFSDGNVGMYGKSYDGLTGLMGAALRAPGLKAVVSQEPVYDMYRYLYSNGVRYTNSLITPALYDGIAATPGPLADDPEYVQNSLDDLQRPGCPALNWLDQQEENHDAAYWKARDYIAKSKGSTVPVFLTQGFLENNTKPDGAFEFYNGLAGPKRAWFGMWDHVRGNEVDDEGNLVMGRQGWFDEVVRFYDQHLKSATPAVADPPIALQTSDGTWRAEEAWPPADAQSLTSELKPGSYTDDASNNGTGEGAGTGVWTFSPPLAHDAHIAGVPRVSLDVTTQLPRANVVANVYDVDSQGSAILVHRGTARVDESGTVDLELLGNDWKLGAGHRIGVLVTSSNSEWWLHVPTLQTVEVTGGSITLPFLTKARTTSIPGGTAAKLESYREEAPFTVEAARIEESTAPAFALPPAQTSGSEPSTGGEPPTGGDAVPTTGTTTSKSGVATASGSAPRRGAATQARGAAVRLTVRLVKRGRTVIASGKAPSGTLLVVKLRRGAGTVAARNVTAKGGAYRVSFPARSAGRYTVSVATLRGALTSARSQSVLVRRR